MWSEPNPFFASASSVCAPSARVSSSLLRAPIGFFAHSHGSGHLRRCQAIADALEVPSVIFTGRAEGAEDPRVSLLPSDDWGSTGGRLCHDRHQANAASGMPSHGAQQLGNGSGGATGQPVPGPTGGRGGPPRGGGPQPQGPIMGYPGMQGTAGQEGQVPAQRRGSARRRR